jgi:hypothetical protein
MEPSIKILLIAPFGELRRTFANPTVAARGGQYDAACLLDAGPSDALRLDRAGLLGRA